MLHVRVTHAIAAIAPSWRDLLLRNGHAATLGPAWLRAGWEATKQPGEELHIVTLHDGTSLVGVMPLRLRTVRVAGMRQRQLSTPGSWPVLPVSGGALLCDRGREQEIAARLEAALGGSAEIGPWDTVWIGPMAGDEAAPALLSAALRRLGACDLAVCGAERFASLPRDLPRSGATGDVQLRWFRDRPIAQIEWIARCSGVDPSALERACAALERDGKVRVASLERHGATVAAAIQLLARDRVLVLPAGGRRLGDADVALHRGLVDEAAALGMREYAFSQPPFGCEAIAPRQRPLRALALERVSPARRVRHALRIGRELARNLIGG